MPTEYTLESRERRRKLRQQIAHNKKTIAAEAERSRDLHNDAISNKSLSEKDRRQLEKNRKTDSFIQAMVFARLGVPVPTHREQEGPNADHTLEDDLDVFEEEDFHAAIRYEDNAITCHLDVPEEDEDLMAYEMLQCTYDTAVRNGHADHSDTENRAAETGSTVTSSFQSTGIDECFVSQLIGTKNNINKHCFPSRAQQYEKFILLLDHLPYKNRDTIHHCLSIGVQTCGDVRNSAWSRALLWFRAPIKVKSWVRRLLTSSYDSGGKVPSLRHLAYKVYHVRLKTHLTTSFHLDDSDATRLTLGRWLPPEALEY